MNKKESGYKLLGLVALLAAVIFDVSLWMQVAASADTPKERIYMFDAGQGDSTLIEFDSGAKVLTDAGPDGTVLDSLRSIFPENSYIDLAVVSHPQLDHFNGFNTLIRHYRFGAFLINGRAADAGARKAWDDLVGELDRRNIPIITLGFPDSISQGNNRIDILSPDPVLIQSAELNDTALIERVTMRKTRILFTGDAGKNLESYLLNKHLDLGAEILKVGHHGSRFSSGTGFLSAVKPTLALIGVGARNTYGHPSLETLASLKKAGAKVFRTDRDGTIVIEPQEGTFLVSASR